jgi:hypothetical protein
MLGRSRITRRCETKESVAAGQACVVYGDFFTSLNKTNYYSEQLDAVMTE